MLLMVPALLAFLLSPRQLLALFGDIIAGGVADDGGLAGGMARGIRPDRRGAAANAVGLLFQTHDATAGLIGNGLLALAARPDLRARLRAEPSDLSRFVAEVHRWDPSVQNTRRFVAEDAVIAGIPVAAGDAVLVVLAAANRDPAANPAPDVFDIDRENRVSFTAGRGPHACPGEQIALTIAAAALRGLMARGIDARVAAPPPAYRPLTNARIPVFAGGLAP